MSKKTDRGAKLIESSRTSGPTAPPGLPPPASSLAVPVVFPGQRPIELKFAAGSTFPTMPRTEQERMVGYLLAYRKALPRLLEEGEAGRFAVIAGDAVAHVWDTADDAMQAASLLIGADRFAVYQVKPQDVDRLACGKEAEAGPCPP